jgi:methylenetetrahydrofolate--tRNA-(uracil-5-)-methyltransferase
MNTRPITVIGDGLAGTEAAFQIASRAVPVRLYEMRPQTPTRIHRSRLLGELLCSNSRKADTLSSAHGLLKAEMRQLDSLVLRAADACRVPAGSALAVDREQFARYLTDAVCRHPGITLVREEVRELPADGFTIVASGPLPSAALTTDISATWEPSNCTSTTRYRPSSLPIRSITPRPLSPRATTAVTARITSIAPWTATCMNGFAKHCAAPSAWRCTR